MSKARVGVFIDGSNTFWGSKHSGIRLDFQKIRDYLDKYYQPVFFNYYGCEDNSPSTPEYALQSNKQKKFHKKLEGIGYNVKRKTLKHLGCGDTKCDMDVELSMDIRNYESDIDCIVLFSGDSDYLNVVEYYWNTGKYIRIIAFAESLSWELKTFAINHPRCSYKVINEIVDQVSRENIPTTT